jgi:hypothetical protein
LPTYEPVFGSVEPRNAGSTHEVKAETPRFGQCVKGDALVVKIEFGIRGSFGLGANLLIQQVIEPDALAVESKKRLQPIQYEPGDAVQ